MAYLNIGSCGRVNQRDINEYNNIIINKQTLIGSSNLCGELTIPLDVYVFGERDSITDIIVNKKMWFLTRKKYGYFFYTFENQIKYSYHRSVVGGRYRNAKVNLNTIVGMNKMFDNYCLV